MLAKHILALVRRDMAESIPVTVFEHELEILKDVHGESNVTVLDEKPDFTPVEVDSGEEFDRLARAYGQNDSGQVIAERVFGRSAKGLEAYAYRAPKKAKSSADEA